MHMQNAFQISMLTRIYLIYDLHVCWSGGYTTLRFACWWGCTRCMVCLL